MGIAVGRRTTYRQNGFPNGQGISERVVEIPWVLTRLERGLRTADIGCGESVYLGEVIRRVGFLHGIDSRPCPFTHPKFRFHRLNVARRMPFRDGFFSQIICISTLEHIGLRGYGNRKFSRGDLRALTELYRVLAPGGRLFVSVPFGRREFHGWFKVYDARQWDLLLNKTEYRVEQEQCYQYTGLPHFYISCRRQNLWHVGYGHDRANGILCAVLSKA